MPTLFVVAILSVPIFGWHFVWTISTCFGILSESWNSLLSSPPSPLYPLFVCCWLLWGKKSIIFGCWIGWGKTLPYWGKIDNFLRLLIGEKLCPLWKFGDIKGDPMGSSGLQGCPKRSGGTFCGITGDQRGVRGTSRGSQGVKGDI